MGSAFIQYSSDGRDQSYLIVAQNPITKNDDNDRFYITKDKRTKKIPIEKVRNITIYYKNIGYPIYLFPGDSININCNNDICFFYGTRENEWNLSTTFINKEYPFFVNFWDFGSVSYDHLLETGQGKLNKGLKAIEKLKDSLKLSEEYVKLITRDMKCAFVKSFTTEHNKYNKRDELSQRLIYEYIKGYSQFFASDSLRNSFVFSYALMSWSEFMARAENGFAQPEKTKTYVHFLGRDLGENYIERLNMAKVMPKANRDDIMYSLMTLRFQTASWIHAEYEPYVSYFKTVCKNKMMVDNILALSGLHFIPPKPSILNSLKNDPEVLGTQLLAYTGNKVSWEELQLLLKGKTTFISFWASWCAPCIQELKVSKPIVAELIKTDKVNFVTISIDEEREKWLKSVDAIGTDSSHQNYQMNLKSGVGKLLLPDGAIPRYMVIDAKGVVRTIEASKLSNIGGHKAIENLIYK